MKIRSKMTLLVVLPLLAVVGLILFNLYHIQRETFERQTQTQIDTLMEGVVRIGREASRARDDLMLYSYLKHLQNERPEIEIIIATWAGKTKILGEVRSDLLYQTRMIPNSTASASSKDGAQDSIQFGFSKKILEREVEENLRVATKQILTLAGIITFVGVLFAIWMGRRLVSPISELVAAVEEVGRGRWDATVSSHGKDEISGLARKFNEMTGQLKDLILFKDDLVHTLSHEVRTPLGALNLYMHALRSDGLPTDPAAQEEMLGTMETAISRMEMTLQSALGLARSGDNQELKLKTVALSKMLHEVLRLFAFSAKSQNLALDASGIEANISVRADDEILRRVVINLISNAIKYTPAGGQVFVGLEAQKDAVCFWVEDTGYGISKDDRESVFTKFYRVQGPDAVSKRIPGSGLGLAIAKKAVDLHGGRIWVEDGRKGGSKFLVLLPKGNDLVTLSVPSVEKNHE